MSEKKARAAHLRICSVNRVNFAETNLHMQKNAHIAHIMQCFKQA